MKRLLVAVALAAVAWGSGLGFTSSAYACDSYVSGYTRSNGTYVNGYYRTCANSTVRDNYSYSGNYNSYTGNYGSNHYYNSPSSEYYSPSYSSYGSYGSGSSYGSGYGWGR